MKEKTIITVSRLWNNPEIKTTISDSGIGLEMNINDFTTAMLEEIGSVTTVLTKAQFKKKFEQAVVNVISGVKQESAKIV